MKRMISISLLMLMLCNVTAVCASPREVPLEDRADPYSLPALSWGETGVNAEAWIDAFTAYLYTDGCINAVNHEDFRLRAYAEDACMFKSARLTNLEVFLGIRDGDAPLLIGVSVHPLPELSDMPPEQQAQALIDYSRVMHACAYANAIVLEDTKAQDTGNVVNALCPNGLAEMVVLGEDVEKTYLQPGMPDITTVYSFRYDADMQFLTFVCEYVLKPVKPAFLPTKLP